MFHFPWVLLLSGLCSPRPASMVSPSLCVLTYLSHNCMLLPYLYSFSHNHLALFLWFSKWAAFTCLTLSKLLRLALVWTRANQHVCPRFVSNFQIAKSNDQYLGLTFLEMLAAFSRVVLSILKKPDFAWLPEQNTLLSRLSSVTAPREEERGVGWTGILQVSVLTRKLGQREKRSTEKTCAWKEIAGLCVT